MSRNEALALVREYTKSDALVKHMLAVESAMRAYAKKFNEDEEAWGITGLLHDFDYEKYPTPAEHPFVGEKILAERGYPEHIRRAILSHADYSGVARSTRIEKALFACDELAGFITAISYVKPSRSVSEVDVASVKKKMKDKAFARSVNRQDIVEGAQELGVPLEEHIDFCVKAMQARAAELGLAGNSATAG